MRIHFALDIDRKGVKTACGRVFDMCSPGECLSNDTESTDCARCLASDEFKAHCTERALVRTQKPCTSTIPIGITITAS